jgi:hypothetical protein
VVIDFTERINIRITKMATVISRGIISTASKKPMRYVRIADSSLEMPKFLVAVAPIK